MARNEVPKRDISIVIKFYQMYILKEKIAKACNLGDKGSDVERDCHSCDKKLLDVY